MSDPIRIEALIPQPLPDLRRVSLTLRVSGLPAYGPSMSSGLLQFHDMPEISDEEAHKAEGNQSPPSSNVDLFLDVSMSDRPPTGDSHELDDRPPSPYPDVRLSIFDHGGNEITTTYIVEHKEPELDFTLHVSSPEPGADYTAYAELTMNDEIIQTVHVPFQLGERA